MPHSSQMGTVIIKCELSYVLGKFWHHPKESAKTFFTHDIFKFKFDEIWPEFISFHLSTLSEPLKKDQPKSMFFETGLLVDLADTKRDLTLRHVFRDFLTSHLIHCLSGLNYGDGFYNDLNHNETYIFVDFPFRIICINGERVLPKGIPDSQKPKDGPIMKRLKAGNSETIMYRGLFHVAFENLKTSEDIILFYNEMIEWHSKYSDYPEDRKNPIEAVNRKIGYEFRHVHSGIHKRWRNALDYDYQSLMLEYSKIRQLPKIPESLEIAA